MRLERTSGSRFGRTAARFLRKPEGPNAAARWVARESGHPGEVITVPLSAQASACSGLPAATWAGVAALASQRGVTSQVIRKRWR